MNSMKKDFFFFFEKESFVVITTLDFPVWVPYMATFKGVNSPRQLAVLESWMSLPTVHESCFLGLDLSLTQCLGPPP